MKNEIRTWYNQMKRTIALYCFLALVLSSCVASNRVLDKKEYRRSKVVATYSGMANEFEDGYLVLKENGYFKFWIIINIKQSSYIGRYDRNNDTLSLNWLSTKPKDIKYYLSKKCAIDTTTKSLFFIDEATNERLWGLGLRSKK